jgi:hypothetical protein
LDFSERPLKSDESHLPSAMRYTDTGTHLGRLASVFSDRMPCTGMYSLPPEHSFSMQDLVTSAASSELSGLDHEATIGSVDLPPLLELPPFDETAELPPFYSSASSMRASVPSDRLDDREHSSYTHVFDRFVDHCT